MIDVLLWRLRFSIRVLNKARKVLQAKTCCYLSTEGKERGYYWRLAAVSRDQTTVRRKTQVATAGFRLGGSAKFEPVTSGWWRAYDLPITQPWPVYKVIVETRVHYKRISICGKKLKLRERFFFQATSDLCAMTVKMSLWIVGPAWRLQTNVTIQNEGFIFKESKRADHLVEERIHIRLESRWFHLFIVWYKTWWMSRERNYAVDQWNWITSTHLRSSFFCFYKLVKKSVTLPRFLGDLNNTISKCYLLLCFVDLNTMETKFSYFRSYPYVVKLLNA